MKAKLLVLYTVFVINLHKCEVWVVRFNQCFLQNEPSQHKTTVFHEQTTVTCLLCNGVYTLLFIYPLMIKCI